MATQGHASRLALILKRSGKSANGLDLITGVLPPKSVNWSPTHSAEGHDEMPLVKFNDLSAYQKHCVREIYNDWEPDEYADFAFWIRKDGQLASRRAGRHQMTDEAAKRHMEKYSGDVRTKGDLREWKPGHSFSFVRD